MALLPKNEPTEKDITPKMFFVWGQSMSGKTYLARQFPNPVIMNTDGNAKKVDTPSVEISDFKTFIKAMQEIEDGKHDFETVVIDLVDDIQTMLEVHVMEELKIEALADAPFGKAYGQVKNTWKRLMVRLSQMPYNVVFISHITETQDDSDTSRTIEIPSLPLKYYNMTLGRCDMSIKCRKIGSNYLQMVVNKRDHYIAEHVKNEQVLEILTGIKGAITESGEESRKPAKKKSAKTGSTSKNAEKANVAQSSTTDEAKKDMGEVAKKTAKKLKPLKK